MASDAVLLERWRGGDQAAGRQLFERYYDAVLRFFRNKVQSGMADLVQETFAACVEGRDKLRQAGSFRSYLFAIAHNVLRGHLRARYRQNDEIDFERVAVRELSPGPSSMVARRREERLLLEALRAIPVAYQVILELRYWEELATHEIADIVDVPHPTVRSRLRRARDMLEAEMARLTRSAHDLQSTLTHLDDWARSCRQLLADAGQPGPRPG